MNARQIEVLLDSLFAVYQPIVRLSDDGIVGHEALARVRDADGAVLRPDLWIPVVEHNQRLSIRLTVAMLEAAVAALERLPGYVAVNIPVSLFGRMKGYLEHIDVRGCASRLVAEVSERGGLGTLAIEAIRDIGESGVRVAMDDVGGGSSRLGLLTLPVGLLKLDMPITRMATEGERMGEVVRAIAALGERLGYEVVAEGIETRAQADALRELGVEYGQGYLFGRPLPLDELPPG